MIVYVFISCQLLVLAERRQYGKEKICKASNRGRKTNDVHVRCPEESI